MECTEGETSWRLGGHPGVSTSPATGPLIATYLAGAPPAARWHDRLGMSDREYRVSDSRVDDSGGLRGR